MKNEFDKNLTDKGWQAMRRLLDLKMPEQPRRRRFAWWWLGALLLFPLAGAGGWWLFGESKPEKTAPPVEKPKISEPVASNLPAFSSDDSKSSDELLAAFYPSGDPKPSDELLAASYSPADTKSSDEVTQDSIQDLTNFQKLSNFAPLPVVPQFVENEIKNTPKPSAVIPFEASITKKHAEPKRWHFGLAAGLASENFSALNGFSAGGAIDWQFARKWGLRSGLQFAQYNLSAEERPVVSLDANDYESATGNDVFDLNTGGGSTPNSSDPSPVYVPIERLQQLEMPLLAYWQPVRPLRVFGGFSTTYVLSAQASRQSFANNQSYFAADQKAQANLNDLTSETLSRWQMSWQVGTGVRLGGHFELDVFYKHGFGSKENNADAQSFDPNVPAGLSGQPNGSFESRYFLLQGIWFF